MRVNFRLFLAGLLIIGMAAVTACGDDNGSSNQDNSGDTGQSSDTSGSNDAGPNNDNPDAGDQDTDPSGDASDSGGDNDGGNNDGGNNTAAGQFCDQMVDAMLLKFEECIGGPRDIWQDFLEESQDPCGVITSGIDDGRITYHASKAQGCLDTLAVLSCDDLSGSSQMPQACQEALEGTVAASGACYEDMECAGDSYCTEEAEQCPGQCAPQVTEGESCQSSTECAGSLECNGTCEQPEDTSTLPGAGEACPDFRCQSGLTCNRVSSVCEEFDREGDTCTQGEGTCETFTYCGSAQTCVRYGSVNDPCGMNDDGAWVGCLPGSYCDMDTQSSGTCAPAKEAGESCESDTECTSLECSEADSVCVAVCAP